MLIYAISRDDRRTVAARTIVEQGGLISVQVMNECVNVMRRKLGFDWPRIVAELDDILVAVGAPLPLTLETHNVAMRVAHAHNVHIYDANIIAAAQLAGCSTLYSEDLQDGRRFGALTLRNPFRS